MRYVVSDIYCVYNDVTKRTPKLELYDDVVNVAYRQNSTDIYIGNIFHKSRYPIVPHGVLGNTRWCFVSD